jgi:adenylosuccinate synthase
MAKARIVIGANYGDEGKGTVVAHYTKESENVLNVLTNGGSQRGHSILTKDGNITFQHFGSGTYHGADNYYSCYFIINPMQFVKEYETLIIKPKHIYRDSRCRWTTPYDSMANLITKKSYNTCGMGIWNTIKRVNGGVLNVSFDKFMSMDETKKLLYLDLIKKYYEKEITIPSEWVDIWDSKVLQLHFINDCAFLKENTIVSSLDTLDYDNLIFENGQGLLLCDTGKDTPDTTPSNTGIRYSLELLKELKNIEDITAHYVTRPYLTRHGDGEMENQIERKYISREVKEDRTNHFNKCQGEFRYGNLDISSLKKRILQDVKGVNFELELTHCDEMDRENDFKKYFDVVNTYDSPLV